LALTEGRRSIYERLKADCELCPELRTLKIVKIQIEIGVGGRTTGDLWLEGRIESDLFIYFPQHCRSRVKCVPDIVVQPCGVKCRQVPHFNTRKQLRGQLHCALAALERWLCDLIDAGIDIAAQIDALLRATNSAAVLGVLVNVGKYRDELARHWFKGFGDVHLV
jgi:hypothetical protein